ncbi:MAG TPA: hypothetical protein VHF89_17575 [Solirubrobacteraceae bacterium]|nr:hypothetical protein [Solirubrobacteraceae bacterium]
MPADDPRPASRPRRRTAARPLGADAGQATVELVALLPLIAVVALGAWQVAVAGHSIWAAGAAARAAARAEAVRGDAAAAARRLLPGRVRGRARIRAEDGGEVRVEVPIRAVVGGGSLFTTTARARFEPQR